MNASFSIISLQILILFKEQSIIILGKNPEQKKMLTKMSTYLLKQKIFSNFAPHETILYHDKRSTKDQSQNQKANSWEKYCIPILCSKC